ncbi:peptide MFS transporter [Acinetobacter gerneri]|uniref:Peptide MFS transporter n=1 Tax=Acinetobacter gerneri TaxID=202952 RepID=A0AAW8JLH4_9GAMM|nr:peptide MFS transporter [Acinetobacter gerneri]MDQ9009059.1 peptide MFS transporter [Acinetobacter gerneri]MDQ9013163.1 peptide MFS transporter [Acinetobacter gerneri]MDQ9024600.1 peptide MFS transporter [Acinetobacter gerneri]MDQ9051835.1 peptide MFS transporter [Acinetobacter gerneri]MDQ9059184.1 peptide MFS transporter [Acinetobacter gerneri]
MFKDLKMQQHDLETQNQAFLGHPKPLKSLFFTELWERFSYYGIRPLLILYMSAMVANGGLGLDRPTAAAIVGLFAGSMYLMTVLGGWVADNWLGQAKSVWYGSMIIALGHLSIALTNIIDHFFFYFGLVLIVIGSGLFKTCISVIVGTLYKEKDVRRDAGFSIFYMGINIGSFIAPLITGLLIKDNGWHLGFGIGGIGMLIALLIFRFSAIPSLRQFNTLRGQENTWNKPVVINTKAPKIVFGFVALVAALVALTALGVITIDPVAVVTYLTMSICICIVVYFAYLLLFMHLNQQEKFQIIICFILLVAAALFWSAFEQKPTSFNLFANDFTQRHFFGFEIPTVWFQSINALFIIIFAPIAAWLWVKLGKKNKDPSYISKFIIALILAASGFLVMAFASTLVAKGNGDLVSPLWIVTSLLLLTLGELCLSPVGLSTMTKLAPTVIRGQIMGLWFTASALGNLMAGLIGGHVSANEIDNLPTLFMRCVIALAIGAIVLWLLKAPIKRLMNKSESVSPQSNMETL